MNYPFIPVNSSINKIIPDMKKILLFSALISLSVFVSCNKQEIGEEIIPTSQDQTTLTTTDGTSDLGTVNAANALTADFSIDNDKDQVNETEDVLLTNKSTNAVSYFWDFGNGDTSTAANPSYQYKIHGYYDVTLRTTDAEGNTKQVSHQIQVLCLFGGEDHNE